MTQISSNSKFFDAVYTCDTIRAALLVNENNVNIYNEIGLPPLIIAIKNNDEKMVRLLLKAGADPNIRTKYPHGRVN